MHSVHRLSFTPRARTDVTRVPLWVPQTAPRRAPHVLAIFGPKFESFERHRACDALNCTLARAGNGTDTIAARSTTVPPVAVYLDRRS